MADCILREVENFWGLKNEMPMQCRRQCFYNKILETIIFYQNILLYCILPPHPQEGFLLDELTYLAILFQAVEPLEAARHWDFPSRPLVASAFEISPHDTGKYETPGPDVNCVARKLLTPLSKWLCPRVGKKLF